MKNDIGSDSERRIASPVQYKLESFVRKHHLTTMRARTILANAGTSRARADAAAVLANSK